MAVRWIHRAATVTAVAAVTVFAGGSIAWANSNVDINDGNVPTTAAGYANHECSANQGGGPYAGQDVWVFVLPGGYAAGKDFVSVTAHFDTNGDSVADTTKTIDTDGGGFLNGGPQVSKAYIATTAGWTLTDASAVITGTADFFNLTHTCAASNGTPVPSPTTPAPSTSASASASTSTSASTSPSSDTSPSTDPSATPSDSVSPSPSGGLAQTGTAVTGIALTGLVLVGGGAALLMVRRRRDNSALDA